ncbi:hypothetical protein [Mesonia sp. K4-1]|jgi:multisubunit Na+/H+ antiporter MnhE subunit|uniref:hypothetical protein n=1 Tax=Mesonia sp. K4-1 TaxID=2602760 RepID=UPI0011CB8119|nr:hypothetical protein [Mesonia sp. K4-1]TXK75370.1 hypothetical protein FT986_10050 [Mesonia sp. K4-1]
MKVKEKTSIILLLIVIILAWLYRGVIEFAYSIPTDEQLIQPEISHPKGIREYIGEAPFYILIGLAAYLVWRIIRANWKLCRKRSKRGDCEK